jgi:hypothetical protein
LTDPFDLPARVWNHSVVNTMQTPWTMDAIPAQRLAALAAIAAAFP